MRKNAALIDMKGIENPEDIFRTTLVYNDSIMQCHFILKKGGAIPLHQHEAVQTGYVIRGKIKFFRGDKNTGFIANTGDSYLFEKNEIHGNEILEDAEVIECFTPVRPEYIDG